MTIRKKIEVSECESDNKMDEFISKGGKIARERKSKGNFFNVLTRIPIDMLEKVDFCVKNKSWMTRTQWFMEAINDKLEKEFFK